MRINHNISALKSFNKLNKNSKLQGSAMEKLSSGLRINRAADDAAGLAISEKMRGQIRGLQMAERNIQDGISLVQSAEAGLATIQDPPLQRLRELAVQASNDTLTQADRVAIQSEVEQIKGGIDEIANHTTFNGIPLLNINDVNASSSNQSGGNSTIEGPGNESGSSLNPPENFSHFPPNVLQGRNMTDDRGRFRFMTSTGYPETNNDDNQYLAKWNMGETDVNGNPMDYDYESSPAIRIKGYEYGIDIFGIAEIVDRKVEDNFDQITWRFSNNDDVQMDVTQTIRVLGDKYEIKYKLTNTSDHMLETGFDFNLALWAGDSVSVIGSEDNEGDLPIGELIEDDIPDSIFVGGYTPAANYIRGEAIITSKDSFEVIEPPDRLVVGQQVWLAQYNTIHEGGVTSVPTSGDLGMSLWWDYRGLEPGASFEVNTFYGLWTPNEYRKGSQPSDNGDTSGAGQDGSSGSDQERSIEGLILQVGPNSGNQFVVQRTDVTIDALGIEDINMLTRDAAQESLEKIDKALETISSQRSKYGAYQNALEHIHNNVSNYQENITTAESRVRDVDMAKELMNQTKQSILSQAAQAMLAQSNQIPQGVLQLLR